MNTFTKSIKMLHRILKHKIYVAGYCFKAGLYLQGIAHDLSKLNPVEFFESVEFYSEHRSSIEESKECNGVSYAWMHHKGHNPHHYEYWQDDFDGGCKPIWMPYKYATELICDYLGAARVYLGKNFSYSNEFDWWEDKSKKCAMHLQTKLFVSEMFRIMKDENSSDVLRKNRSIPIFMQSIDRYMIEETKNLIV